jgi:uncharacterized protein involved in outer membrane biogenesis
MPFDQLDKLSAWMAEAGIDELELTGPSFRLRLNGDGRQAHDDPTGDRESETASGQMPSSDVVAASTVGLFLHRHPLHETALAPEGNIEVAKLDAHWAEQQRTHWETAINEALIKGGIHD